MTPSPLTELQRLGQEFDRGWRDISSAPRDGTRFLGLTRFGVEMVKWCDGARADNYGPHAGWIGVEQDSSCLPAGQLRTKSQHQPTHWMPLPAPPPSCAVCSAPDYACDHAELHAKGLIPLEERR